MSDETSGSGANWRVIATVMTAANPLLLLLVGYFLNGNINDARKQIDQNKEALAELQSHATTESITTRTRLDKAAAVKEFMDLLTGPDEVRRQLAIEAVRIALNEDADRLLIAMVRVGPKSGTITAQDVASATAALDYGRQPLIQDMFSDVPKTRRDAQQTLRRSKTDDWTLISQLIDRANRDLADRKAAGFPAKPADPKGEQQRASVYNVVSFLTDAQVPGDKALRERIAGFAEAAAPNSDDTGKVAQTVQDRMR